MLRYGSELVSSLKKFLANIENNVNLLYSYFNYGIIFKEVFMRHLMSPLDFSVEELDKLMDLADDIKANPAKYAHACGWHQ